MTRLHYELLTLLKNQFEKNGGQANISGCADKVSDSHSPVSARRFWLKQWEENLVEPMNEVHRREYGEGAGKELDGKMRALRSSSAMTFNVLGNGPISVGGRKSVIPAGVYSVSYEHREPALRANVSSRKAHLDAWLQSDDGKTIVACEMKLMEWLDSPKRELSEKYFVPESYPNFVSAEKFFIPMARKLVVANIQRYDWRQMLKHAIAVFNGMESRRRIKHVKLLNVVWEPNAELLDETIREKFRVRRDEERKGFETFKEITKPLAYLFKEFYGQSFTLDYMTVGELIDIVDRPAEIKTKLRRYQ